MVISAQILQYLEFWSSWCLFREPKRSGEEVKQDVGYGPRRCGIVRARSSPPLPPEITSCHLREATHIFYGLVYLSFESRVNLWSWLDADFWLPILNFYGKLMKISFGRRHDGKPSK